MPDKADQILLKLIDLPHILLWLAIAGWLILAFSQPLSTALDIEAELKKLLPGVAVASIVVSALVIGAYVPWFSERVNYFVIDQKLKHGVYYLLPEDKPLFLLMLILKIKEPLEYFGDVDFLVERRIVVKQPDQGNDAPYRMPQYLFEFFQRNRLEVLSRCFWYEAEMPYAVYARAANPSIREAVAGFYVTNAEKLGVSEEIWRKTLAKVSAEVAASQMPDGTEWH